MWMQKNMPNIWRIFEPGLKRSEYSRSEISVFNNPYDFPSIRVCSALNFGSFIWQEHLPLNQG